MKRMKLTWAALLVTPCAAPAQTVPPPPMPDYSAHILTPAAPLTPRINGPALFGVRPGRPILYRVPVTGAKPISYAATGLPKGVTIDPKTGQIGGSVSRPGTYRITLRASNARGRAERPFRLVVGDKIALTPPLGWNSYNIWGTTINQAQILAAARGMVSSGLIDHGWSYINIDDGWQGPRGGPLNALQPDFTRFSDIRLLADQVHAMGLKIGIYHSPWVVSYGGRLGGSAENPAGAKQVWPKDVARNKKQLPYAIGRHHFTTNDARQFADWGIDYLKYDWGPIEYPETKEMHDALAGQNRDIVFTLSNNAAKNLFGEIARVSTVAHAWRTTNDIFDSWQRIGEVIGFNQDQWAPFAGPGRYTDADMLVLGMVGWGADKQHPTKLTADEQFTHMSLWSLLASPLLLGNNMDNLDPFTLSLLTNDEVLAVNQDALGKQGVTVAKDGELQVYRKPLEDGSIAVGLFNRGEAEARVTARWADLGLTGRATVRDLWRQKDLGTHDTAFSAAVKPHGVLLLRLVAAR